MDENRECDDAILDTRLRAVGGNDDEDEPRRMRKTLQLNLNDNLFKKTKKTLLYKNLKLLKHFREFQSLKIKVNALGMTFRKINKVSAIY